MNNFNNWQNGKFRTQFSESARQKYYLFLTLYKLMATSLCVMVGNAKAERVFSLQNRIKTQLRNQLSIGRLDKLMRIMYHGNITERHLQAAVAKVLGTRNQRI